MLHGALLLLAAWVFCTSGCARPADGLAAWTLPDAELALDLAQVPQDLFWFATKAEEEAAFAPLAGAEEQAAAAARAAGLLFSPWLAPGPIRSLEEIRIELARFKAEKGFMENLRPFSPARWDEILGNCALEAYPGLNLPAITVRVCDLRLLPTRQPYFLNPARPGEGFPFDYLQNSSLPPGTPVRLTHLSADQAWVLLESPSAKGWAELENLALASPRFMLDWLSRPMAALLEEKIPLRPKTDKRTRTDQALPAPPCLASIGTILPLESNPRLHGPLEKGQIALYFPERGEDGYARMRLTILPSRQAAAWPLPLSRKSLAALGMRMLGQPYGWGGYGGNRDCSSTLRDLFMPFGLWLPRNSLAQASLGHPLDLSGLDPEPKEAVILQQGRPFLSLVGLPGHIALYLGQHQDRAIIFHNIWGLRTTRPGSPLTGRAILGKAVITTLTPGRERPDLAQTLLENTRSLNRLLSPSPLAQSGGE